MTICRYFAQGNCRYGDRCRFEHVTSSYNKQSYNDQWNTGNYEGQYGSNYYGRDNEYKNYRQETRKHNYDDYGDNENYEYNEKFTRYSGQNIQQNRNRRGYEQQYRTNEQNFGKKQYQQAYEYENDNRYGQNRFRWLSDDYKNQARSSVGQSDYEYGNDSYTTSTPKGKPSFSFKLPESEVKKESSPFFQINGQDQLLTEKIQDDAKSWELGGQWPFTCYFPYPNKCAFPGFYNVSPEELRFAAYKAEKENSSKAYVEAVQNALNQVSQQRSELQIVTPQLLATLRKINEGEDIYTTSKKFNPIASIYPGDNVVEIMDMPDMLLASNNAAAAFSFKTPTDVNSAAAAFSFKTPTAASDAAAAFSFKTPAATSDAAASFSFKIQSATDSANKMNDSSFSFRLPPGTDIKPVTTAASDGDANIYTPLGNLTDEEKEQFSASTFVLGKIPTKPPSLVFCN